MRYAKYSKLNFCLPIALDFYSVNTFAKLKQDVNLLFNIIPY